MFADALNVVCCHVSMTDLYTLYNLAYVEKYKASLYLLSPNTIATSGALFSLKKHYVTLTRPNCYDSTSSAKQVKN